MIKNIVILCLTIIYAKATPTSNNASWQRRWFPNDPSESDHNPVVSSKDNGTPPDLADPMHGIVMGVADSRCDDGKGNLTLDWDLSALNYTCVDSMKHYRPKSVIHPIHDREFIPRDYHAPHKCMNETIEYDHIVPTFGPHRPLWPRYGEYTFVPIQRWLHNLEHGAVVMLYHPCAHPVEVDLLKNIVQGCLYRHVITPYNLLPPNRPLVLATWGHRLEMSKVAKDVVINFIKNHALNGFEKTPRDGQYDLMLKKPARIVSDLDDTNLCPGM